ncbi:FSH1-domain-containing protein [Suhomyces tanzawaensis NRRL Y-17324]|uniref:FSH1-domain-containing protein n=1 Tax=Suhomyces tanzawaensis NRRL Y-17324 TaxID=984487 RepID=A0A1E4SMK5_9ASCO|nr:FSH1-domain-containing protein [Suhomyces tanzawaensis NRRL Y-17324]ODV80718.1 FSH1-domain-containing protein [Suhomyces tanzawaensis NRRL Y-17324]
MKKVLCFGGYLQGAEVFAEKSASLRQLLAEKNFQLEYLDPPIKLSQEPGFTTPFSKVTTKSGETVWERAIRRDSDRAWWRHNSGVNRGLEAAVDYVMDYVKRTGPYVGVVGFSQGACLAAMVANTIHKRLPQHPPLQFALVFSGFAFTQPLNCDRAEVQRYEHDFSNYAPRVTLLRGYEQFFEIPPDLSTKMVLVYGTSDSVVLPVRTQYLASLYPNPVVITFDGHHHLPRDPRVLASIVQHLELRRTHSL